jgi:hypothetical protein
MHLSVVLKLLKRAICSQGESRVTTSPIEIANYAVELAKQEYTELRAIFQSLDAKCQSLAGTGATLLALVLVFIPEHLGTSLSVLVWLIVAVASVLLVASAVVLITSWVRWLPSPPSSSLKIEELLAVLREAGDVRGRFQNAVLSQIQPLQESNAQLVRAVEWRAKWIIVGQVLLLLAIILTASLIAVMIRERITVTGV